MASAAAAGLRYSSDTRPGITRTRHGKTFRYYSPQGRRITAAEDLERFRALVIPPAWEDVWICPDPRGHLQATGRDFRGRKQYRYHPRWRQVRDETKYDRMLGFAQALPRIRQHTARDMRRSGMPREKVLATVVQLLEKTLIRVGNDEYARQNRSFGLTTLRDGNVDVRAGKVRFTFRGKSGVEHEVRIDNRQVVKVIRDCQELRGRHLFQYLDDNGKRRPVGAEQVNAYLREIMDAEFTAKDFRTWSGTLRAFEIMLNTPLPESPTKRALKVCIVAATRKVAEELRNTPAVCRKSYINPLVFSAWQKGDLHRCLREPTEGMQETLECLVLSFLREEKARSAMKIT